MARRSTKQVSDDRLSPASPTTAKETVRRDVMSVEKRSALMSRIRGRDTGPELRVAALLAAAGLEWESHCGDLPGRPDFVFRGSRVAVYVDGDFWHGWRFPLWKDKLAPFWAEKIGKNRERDRRNHARMRGRGWTVVRVWEHQLERDEEAVLARITARLPPRSGRPRGPGFSRERR